MSEKKGKLFTMEVKWRILRTLLWKNYLTRKRHWKQIIFAQILFPLCIFVLLQKVRSPRWYSKEEDLVTYYDMETKQSLLKDLEDFHLYYTPRNNFTKKLIERTVKCLSLSPDNVTAFSSEEMMLKNYTYEHGFDMYDVKMLAIVFKNTYDERELDYVLRTSFDTPTNSLGGIFQGYSHYYLRECFTNRIPYIQTQMCLDESFINISIQNPYFTPKVTIQRFPDYNKVKIRTSEEVTRFFFATSAVVLFLITVITEASFSAREKYTGVNILMNLKGIQFYENLFSWLVTGTLQGIFFSTLIIIVMTQCFENPILSYGNSFIIWLFFIFHFGHLTAFGMHFSSYFSKTLTMEIVISILYVGSSMFQADLIDSYMFALIPYLGIVFPNILLFRMFQEMDNYEALAIGVQWSSMFKVSDAPYSAAGSIGVLIIFSLLGMVLHFLSSVYVNVVFPGKFGLKHHPFYLLQKKENIYKELEEELDEFHYADEDGKPFENIPKGIFTPGIQVRNVKKSYTTNLFNKKENEALHGISLDIYKGQITTLLGRNRSGKTALMSILTGISEPNEGVVFIDGKRINDFFKYFSTDLSFCPQENMFFLDLTVMEQIEFFGLLNSINKSEDERKMLSFNVEKLMKRLNIYDKRHSFPKELSFSEQRRLCLGISLICDSKILIFDEPTSGMDSESKRNTWNMLLDMKGEKTILISTKDTEEADTLSDKIAILHLGILKGYGTATFLKKLYGQGNIEVTLSVTTWCNTESIRQELGVQSELLKLEDETMTLCCPCSEKLFESLDRIENQKREFGVISVKVSLITLEQVVLKVTKKEEDIDLTRPFVNSAYKLKDRELLRQSAFALIEKNITFIRRNWKIFLQMMAFPLISSIFMIMNFSSMNTERELKYISLNLYNEPQVWLATSNKTFSRETKSYVSHFGAKFKEIDQTTNMNDALIKLSSKDVTVLRNNLVTAIEFNMTGKSLNANALYSETAGFSLPIGINIISNTLYKTLSGDDYTISVSDHPLPKLRSYTSYDLYTLSLLFTFFLFPAIAFFGIFPSQEISSGLKHLQTMTGIPSYIYWGCQFIVDFVLFLLLIIVCLIALSIVDHVVGLEVYWSTELGIATLLLILLALNALPMTYIFSYTKMTKNNVVFTLGLLPFVLLLIEGFFWLLEFESYPYYYNFESESYERRHTTFFHFRQVQKRFFQLIPHISFFHGQVAFLTTAIENAHCRYLVQHDIADHFFEEYCEDLECHGGSCKKSLPYFGRDPKYSHAEIPLEECITFMSLTPFLYCAILAAIENKFFQKLYAKYLTKPQLPNNDEIDEKVKEEKYTVGFEVNKLKAECASKKANKLVTERVDDDTAFLAYELNKSWKTKQIIKDVNFSVKSGECFGLLGVNSVGKSTIFKIITGEELSDNGDMFLKGYGMSFDRKEYLSQIGYCPQNTALIDSLNARDHLRLFTQIRGMPKNQVNLEVEEWIKRLNLSDCASEPCYTYSAGNKRCLNIAMAFIGHPDLVLLDEPTIGIDPASRKSFWNMLKSFLRAGQSVILTSHCMEECEALCKRLAILAKGQLVCIGTSEELKQHFGTGYNIIIELNPEYADAQTNALKYDLENSINCEIRDVHLSNITYYVKNSETTWKTMYDLMKRLQQKYSCITDFTILSATLEEVFLRFVKLKG